MTAPFKLPRLGAEAFCILDIDVEKMSRVMRRTAVAKRVACSLTGETLERRFAPVVVKLGDDDAGTLYWADLATGTLYTLQGACMSSDYLRMLIND